MDQQIEKTQNILVFVKKYITQKMCFVICLHTPVPVPWTKVQIGKKIY
jgi:hypothetical protein